MDDPFVQLDRDIAIERLRLVERGEEQGALNLPSAGTHTLDNVEQEIVADIRDQYRDAQIVASNQLRTYEGRIADLALLGKTASISGKAKTAVADVRAEIAIYRNRLATSRDAITSSYAELRDFRSANGLKRPAHPVPLPLVTWGAIFTSWFLETILNTILLRFNDDMGLLGGFAAAAAVGAINVFVAAAVGRMAWPQLHLPSGSKRTAALAAISLWVIFVLFWNLMAAHYRDAKASGVPNPEAIAPRLLVEQTFALDSIYSWALLIAGLAFAIIAANAAYRLDDPYPGYGETHRRHNERCDDYSSEIESATEALRVIRDDAIAEATNVRDQLQVQHRERERVIAGRSAFLTRYEQHGEYLEQTANSLLEVYRVANRQSRTAPAPAHFDKKWELLRAKLEPQSLSSDLLRDIERAEHSLDIAIEEIVTAFNAAIDSFEPLDTLKERLANG